MKGTSVKPKVPKVLKKDQTQAHIVAVATALITQVVAYVPKWAPEKQLLISAAGIVIAAAFLIAHAIQSGKASPADLARAVESEVGKVDFSALAKDALSGNAAGVVQDELRKVLAGGLGAVAAPAAPAPAPVAVTPPVTPQATS